LDRKNCEEAEHESIQLEKRVTTLEKQVAELAAQVAKFNHEPDWRRAVGMFTGSEFMKRVDAAGEAIREKDRERAKRRYPKVERDKK
jgi:hypothetical protein